MEIYLYSPVATCGVPWRTVVCLRWGRYAIRKFPSAGHLFRDLVGKFGVPAELAGTKLSAAALQGHGRITLRWT